MIVPVILSGGSGTRLWPLSTPRKPKQFLPLVSDRTLFQETVARLHGLPDLAEPIVVCNEAHASLVAEQLGQIGAKARAIVLEPAARNTAPAIAAAALLAKSGSEPFSAAAEKGSDPILLVLPADHVVADAGAFRAAVGRAVEAAAAGRLVTFGIVPTRAETGYGYIERGDDDEGGWSAVARFVEKPDRETAERYLVSGRFLWNSGMFVFGAEGFLAELERLAPRIAAACRAATEGASREGAFTRLGPAFLDSPFDSIDFALMEKTDRAAVVPLDAGWSDIGSWAALHSVLKQDRDGNVLRGRAEVLDTSNSLVVSGLRRVALLGLDNVVVIDADDALLIMSKDHSQALKDLLRTLEDDSSQT